MSKSIGRLAGVILCLASISLSVEWDLLSESIAVFASWEKRASLSPSNPGEMMDTLGNLYAQGRWALWTQAGQVATPTRTAIPTWFLSPTMVASPTRTATATAVVLPSPIAGVLETPLSPTMAASPTKEATATSVSFSTVVLGTPLSPLAETSTQTMTPRPLATNTASNTPSAKRVPSSTCTREVKAPTGTETRPETLAAATSAPLVLPPATEAAIAALTSTPQPGVLLAKGPLNLPIASTAGAVVLGLVALWLWMGHRRAASKG